MNFSVRYAAAARDDLLRLYDHLLARVVSLEDLPIAEEALKAISSALDALKRFPLIHRRAGTDPFVRQLIIPFGRAGYVALFEVTDASTVTILALRHQREDDYH